MNQSFITIKLNMVLFVLALTIGNTTYGFNEAKVDSLLQVLKQTTSEQHQGKILLQLSELYSTQDFAQSEAYLNQALALPSIQEYDTLYMDLLKTRGVIVLRQSRFDEALQNFEASAEVAKAMDYSLALARNYNNMGETYMKWGKVAEAQDYLEQSLAIKKELQDSAGVVHSSNVLGRLLYNQGKYEEAMEYYLEAVVIAEQIDALRLLAILYNNISLIHRNEKRFDKSEEYLDLATEVAEQLDDNVVKVELIITRGNLFFMSDNYERAIEAYLQGYELTKKVGFSTSTVTFLVNLGNVSGKMGNYEEVIKYGKEALELSKKSGYKINQLYSHVMVGDAFKNLHRFSEAIAQYEVALQIAIEINAREILDVYQVLAKAYKESGNYQKALEYQSNYIAAKDSMDTENNKAKMAEMEAKYEHEKLQRELEEQSTALTIQEKENEIQALQISNNYYVIGGLLLLITMMVLMAWFYSRQNKIKAQQRTVVLEQKLLRSQMNPHFIFNSLIAIQNYIVNNNARDASNYLSNFARLMRLILENTREEMITLDREIQTLNLYLELQQLRHSSKFTYVIEVADSLNVELAVIPPMFAQPFIENAIEHGIEPKEGVGKIHVKFWQDGKQLIMEILDNGVGLHAQKSTTHQYRSLATTITSERVELMKKKNGGGIAFKVVDLVDDSSEFNTKVTFVFPISYT